MTDPHQPQKEYRCCCCEDCKHDGQSECPAPKCKTAGELRFFQSVVKVTGCQHQKSTRPAPASTPAPDDIDLEELGNQDIDPKAFEIYARTCDEAAKEQYFRELAEKQCQEQHDAAIARQAREQVLPTDKELDALKQAVCHALNDRVDGYELADNYYHKLKSLRSQQQGGGK